MSIILAILVFCFIVVVHEFGHYIAAVSNGVKVLEFAIGMGPKIFSKKIGDTVWAVRLLPIGGQCVMLGEDFLEDNKTRTAQDETQDETQGVEGEEQGEAAEVAETTPDIDRERSLNAKPVWRRIIIISGGVIANVVSALIIASAVALCRGFYAPEIGSFVEGGAAESSALRAGDVIVGMGDSKINVYDDVSFFMYDADGSPIDITVKRGGERLVCTVTPRLITDESGAKAYKIGFYPVRKSPLFGKAAEGTIRAGFGESLKNGAYSAAFYVKSAYMGLYYMIRGRVSAGDMSGPIGIVSMVSDSYNQTAENSGVGAALWSLLYLMGFLSANLAAVNLLPIPALDGGRLVFLIIEGIRRKPVNRNVEGIIHLVGFALLMLLVLVIAINDVRKLI